MTELNGSWPMIGTLGRNRNPTTPPINRPSLESLISIEDPSSCYEGPGWTNSNSVLGWESLSGRIGSFFQHEYSAILSHDDSAESPWLKMQVTFDRTSKRTASFSQFGK